MGARFSAPGQSGPGAHKASCTMGTGTFPGVKSGRGVTLTPHPLLVSWSRKSRYIPLLTLWAVRPVQSLSACTRVHFTCTLPTVNFTFEKKSVRRPLLWLQRVIAVATVYKKYVQLYINQFASVLIGNNIFYGQKMLHRNAPTIKLPSRCPSVLPAHRGLFVETSKIYGVLFRSFRHLCPVPDFLLL